MSYKKIIEKLKNEKNFLIAVFASALFLRIFFFTLAYHNNGNNVDIVFANDGYHEIAENILAGNGFSWQSSQPFVPDTVRTPLYPYFIATILYFFNSYMVVALIQILIASLMPILSYFIALEIIPNRKIAGLVAIIIAAEPIFILESFLLLTETLCTFLFLLFLLFFYRAVKQNNPTYLAASSVFLGLTTLARPTTQYLPIIIFVILFFTWNRGVKKLSLKPILIFAGVFLAIISPWLTRNYLLINRVTLSQQPEIAFYTAFLPSAVALEENIGFETARTKVLSERGISLDYNELNAEKLTEMRANIGMEVMNHKQGSILTAIMSATTFLTQDAYINFLSRIGYNNLGNPRPQETSPLVLLFKSPASLLTLVSGLVLGPGIIVILGRAFWILVLVFFCIGLIMLIGNKKRRTDALLGGTFVAYFTLTACLIGYGVSARYRMPIDPIMLSVALYAACTLLKKYTGYQTLLNHNG